MSTSLSFRSFAAALGCALILAAPASAGDYGKHHMSADSAEKPATAALDIVDTAVAAGSFKTLAAALTAAGLVDTLKGAGPFTVFAPTDEAFAKLPAGTVETLLKPENKDQLVAVLTYHVVAGKVEAKDVVGLPSAVSVQGQRIAITSGDDGVMVDSAHVVKTDIAASNGVIHVIDAVLLPNTPRNLVQTAKGAGTFNTLVAALQAAGLTDALSGDQPLTVFAPTDAAFAALGEAKLAELLKPENKDQLAAILKYHVVAGKVQAAQATQLSSAETLQGSSFKIAAEGDAVRVNDAKVTATDIDATNGVIHVIDKVLVPAS